MKHIAIVLVIFVWTLSPAPNLWAQSASATTYISDVDKEITIHKMALLPVTDNVGGLYGRYVENKLADQVKNSHRFNLGEAKDLDPRQTIDDYENQPDLVKSVGSKNNVDALVGAKVVKHRKGVNITIDLFLVSDGQLFAQESLIDDPHFSSAEVEQKTAELYQKLLTKIPYKAMVLSREGNRVTLDIGTRDGIHDNIVVTAEQVVALKRHPKFNFVLGSEKEILGKIKIAKADTTLSFGVVLSEKDKGVIQKDTKITGLDYVTYSDTPGAALQPGENIEPGKDTVSFGKHPKEWLPAKKPTIGKVNLSLGLGSYHNALALSTTSYSSDVGLYPQLALSGEIWITPEWFVAAGLTQGVLSVANPASGSQPGNLGANNSHYDFHGGYKFLLQDDFYGPQIDLHMGMSKYSNFIDASTPQTFSAASYSGLYLGIGGSIPLNEERTWYIDVNLDRTLFPAFSETPFTNGASSDSSITTFNFGPDYKLNNQFWITGHFKFEFYSSTYSGVGTRSDGATGLNSSQSLITLFTGIDYRF